MEFGILGPLAVWRDGQEVELGAAKQRALLAVLLLHAGEPMSTERLVDALWGEQPPRRPVKALQVHVSQLRKTLGDGRGRDAAARATWCGSSRRRARSAAVRAAARRGPAAARRGRGRRRRATCCARRSRSGAARRSRTSATRRSRANEIGRLEGLRLVALEQRLEADLAVGRNAEAVPELEALVRDHPLRESLRGLLMLALYRSGRQADALAVMQDARATLRDELGLDPGQALQQLEKAILLQDPSLDATAAPLRRPRRASAAPVGAQPPTPILPPPAEVEHARRSGRS